MPRATDHPDETHRPRHRWWNPAMRVAAAAAGAWSVVYVAIWASGERFSTGYLDYGWQIVPWDILSSDPIRSVWFLHVQPPGWNLALGLSGWLSPFPDAITLQLLMAVFGAVGAAFAALVGRQLGLPNQGAVAVALVATLHPEVLRTAFEPTYELPVATLLLINTWALGRCARQSGQVFGAGVVVVAVTAVVLTRSLFHPVWLAFMVAAAWWLVRGRVTRRHVVLGVLVPLVLVGGWMGKNQVLFGEPTLSSWFGMNLQRAVIPVLDADELGTMRDRREVSDIAMIGPFGAYELYSGVVDPCEPGYAHRSVSEATRTTDEYSPNFNYQCYLPIFHQAGDDAWAVIRAHPDVWLEGRLWSLRTTFAVNDGPKKSESVVMRVLAGVYEVARVDVPGAISTQSWGTPIFGSLVAPARFGLVPVGMYLAIAVLGVVELWRLLRRRSRHLVTTAVVVAGSAAAVWTVVVGAIGELGEQARFRTMADPVVWVVVIGLVVQFIRRPRESART